MECQNQFYIFYVTHTWYVYACFYVIFHTLKFIYHLMLNNWWYHWLLNFHLFISFISLALVPSHSFRYISLNPSHTSSTMIGDSIEEIVNHYRMTDDGVKLTQESIISIRNSLLTWYNDSRRKLPWRGDKIDENGEPFDNIMEELKFPNAYGTWVRCVMT